MIGINNCTDKNKLSENVKASFIKNMWLLPQFDRDELQLGSFLGTGGFSHVYAIERIEVLDFYKENVSSHENIINECPNDRINNQNSMDIVKVKGKRVEDKYSMANNCLTKAGQFRYAMKFLKENPEKYSYNSRNHLGRESLFNEAYLLSNINHPNIIKIRGISSPSYSLSRADSCVMKNISFFVMDKLQNTLERKIEAWAKQSKILIKKFLQNYMLSQRLKIMVDISDAMEYLHKMNIIHRDLKPENIGFDSNGVVKIFDFGLARLVDDYKLTGVVGTLRYMAPEVSKGFSYDETADVYSFGILLWEIITLQKPFSHHNKENHLRYMALGERPKKLKIIPPLLFDLMEQCWSDDAYERPTFRFISQRLREEISHLKYLSNTMHLGQKMIMKKMKRKTNHSLQA